MDLPQILFHGPFTEEQISINETVSNRKTNEEIESKITKIWDETVIEAQRNNIKIWDSVTYRLNSFDHEGETINLKIAEISFKTRLGLRQCREELLILGSEYYANGLYVSTLIKTRDGKFIFGVLNNNTLTATRRRVNMIGGVLSKSERIVHSSKDLFGCLYIELDEEINIAQRHIRTCILLGAIHTVNTQVGLFFLTELTLTAQETVQMHSNNNDMEIKELEIVDEKDLTSYLLNNFPDHKALLCNLLPEKIIAATETLT